MSRDRINYEHSKAEKEAQGIDRQQRIQAQIFADFVDKEYADRNKNIHDPLT